MQKSPESLQHHLRLWLTVSVVGLFALSAIGTFLFMKRVLVAQLDRHLKSVAQDFIAETSRLEDGSIESDYHELDLPDYQAGPAGPRAFYELRTIDGKIILKSPSLPADEELQFVPQLGHPQKILSMGLPDGRNGRALYVCFTPKQERSEGSGAEIEVAGSKKLSDASNEESEQICLTIAESTEGLARTLLILGATLAVTGSVLGGVTLLLVRLLVGQACRPIVELGEMTAAIDTNDLGSRLPTDRIPSELRPLIVQFNQLIGRVDDAINREKRFSMDIAHELRTPASELHLLMQLGSLSNYPDVEAGSLEDPREIYRLGGEITERINTILETLIAIHRGQSHAIELAQEPVDLDAILQEAIASLESDQTERVSLTVATVGKRNELTTDPVLLRAIFDNLLSNAIAHSPPGSPIGVVVSDTCVMIENQSSDLTDSDLSSIDEPFWQKDSSRTEQNHFGLGLTLVGLYIRILGGEISNTLSDGKFTASILFEGRKD